MSMKIKAIFLIIELQRDYNIFDSYILFSFAIFNRIFEILLANEFNFSSKRENVWNEAIFFYDEN